MNPTSENTEVIEDGREQRRQHFESVAIDQTIPDHLALMRHHLAEIDRTPEHVDVHRVALVCLVDYADASANDPTPRNIAWCVRNYRTARERVLAATGQPRGDA